MEFCSACGAQATEMVLVEVVHISIKDGKQRRKREQNIAKSVVRSTCKSASNVGPARSPNPGGGVAATFVLHFFVFIPPHFLHLRLRTPAQTSQDWLRVRLFKTPNISVQIFCILLGVKTTLQR